MVIPKIIVRIARILMIIIKIMVVMVMARMLLIPVNNNSSPGFSRSPQVSTSSCFKQQPLGLHFPAKKPIVASKAFWLEADSADCTFTDFTVASRLPGALSLPHALALYTSSGYTG